MTCREFWNGMPELEATPEALEHGRQCASCAARLEGQSDLAAGLKRLTLDRQQAPPWVEARLLEAFREQAGRAPRVLPFPQAALSRPIRWVAWVTAVAAMIALGVFLVRSRQPEPIHTLVAGTVIAEPAADDSAESDFMPVPYSVQSVPVEEADLVRVEVPRSALIALGLPVAADASAGNVEAVVALSTDGVVQGVRILQ